MTVRAIKRSSVLDFVYITDEQFFLKLTTLQHFKILWNGSDSLQLNNAKDSVIQAESGFIAVNLTLSTFPCTILRSSLLGGGVNSSPGQLAIALSSIGLSV